MKRYALIGRRLGHSYSQRWFEELFARQGLEDHSYRLVELPSVAGVREWVEREGINGFNVTVPYKQDVVAQLDALDETAAAIGAVNCVTVEGGRLIGHNTDAPAFLQTIEESRFETGDAFILGTGGAARAVAYALEQRGVLCRFVSRHPEEHPNAIGYDDLSSFNTQRSMLVNATPVGMYPDIEATPLPDFPFQFSFVYDLVYNPSPTRLLRDAAARGAQVKDGLEMLHLQAELSWEWFQKGELMNLGK